MASMKLETHEGTFADPAQIEHIAPAVEGLTEVGKAYIILDNGDETYVQAAGTVGEHFIVERRDSCAGEHYRCDQRVTAADLVIILSRYLHGSPDWSHGLTWHRVKVDGDAPSA